MCIPISIVGFRPTTRAVREKYLGISAPASWDLSLLAKWGETRILDIRETRQLNDKFMPLLESQAMVSSLILADTDGREYFLLREGASWLTRSSEEFRSGMQVNLNRWSSGGDLLETWREKRTFDPRNRSCFAGALQLTGSGTIFWDDKCGLHAKNLLNQHIGAEFSRYIDCDLKSVNGKTIVVITCEKVTDPVFLAVGKNEDPNVFLLKKDQITSRKWKSITLLIFRKSPTSRVTMVAPICRASSAIQTSL